MPVGFSNTCESDDHDWSNYTYESGVCKKCAKSYKTHNTEGITDTYKCHYFHTKPEVLHAESNALMKVAKSTFSCENANMYITYYPCFECAKLIISCRILNLYVLDDVFLATYSTSYKDLSEHQLRAQKSEQLFRDAHLIVKCYDSDYNLYRDKGAMCNRSIKQL